MQTESMPPTTPKRPSRAAAPRQSLAPTTVALDGSGWPVPPTDRPLPSLAPETDPLWAALDAVPDAVSVMTAIRHDGGYWFGKPAPID